MQHCHSRDILTGIPHQSQTHPVSGTEIFSGDILVSRLPEPVGRACIVPEKAERMITAVDCTICRPNESLINKEYLCYFMRSKTYYTRLLGNVMQIPLHRITDSASNGSVFPVVTEHFSASSDHAFL